MSLTTKDARVILGMVARGDNKHDIAAWFGVNQARIKEAEDGAYGTHEAAPAAELFPKGAPGPKLRAVMGYIEKARQALEQGDIKSVAAILADAASRYQRYEA